MRKKNIKEKISTLLIYLLIFLVLLIGAMFLIKNNLNGQTPSDFQSVVDMGGVQEYEFRFMGILMQKTTITIAESGIIDVDSKNYSALFYMPLIFSILGTAFITVIITCIKRHTQKYII